MSDYGPKDIVEAIVAGTEPDGLSIVRLFRGLPRSWPEQRRELGFMERDSSH